MARARRGCGGAPEVIPTCLSISGNTLIYETNTGEIKQVPLPFGDITFDPSTCMVSYTNENGVVESFSIADVLLKSQDYLIFDQDACTLKYSDVNGNCDVWDIGAAILAKLQDGSTWDASTCVLSLTNTTGNTQNYDLSAVLDKIKTDLTWNPESCELDFVDPLGGTSTFNLTSLLNKIETDLEFDADTCTLKFTGPTGECSSFDLTAILHKLCIYTNLEFDPTSCTLKFTNPAGQCTQWDLGAALANKDEDKCYIHQYDPATHTVTLVETTSGAIVSTTQLNCGSLAWDAANCRLVYTDEKGFAQPVPLPNFITDCAFNPATRIISFTSCDGTVEQKDLGSDSFSVNIGAGTFTHIDVNGNPVTVDVCQLAEKCKPSLTATNNEDGSKTFCFDDGYGLVTCCDIPAVTLDIDNVVVNGSAITFTGGGDGNPQIVTWDVCDIVAQNCNAHFSQINSDGSWTFIDNAGNTYNWAPIVTTLVDNGNGSFTYVNEDGVVTTVDMCCTNVTEDADNYYVTDHNGNIAPICKRPTKDVIFNGVTYPPDASGSVVINYEPEIPEQCCDEVISSDGSVVITASPNGAGPGQTFDLTGCCDEVVSSDGSVTIVTSPNGPGSGNTYDISVEPGCCTTFSTDPAVYDPSAPPTTPVTPPVTKNDGDAHVVCMNGAICAYICVAGNWALQWCCPLGSEQSSEVWVGSDEPPKQSEGGSYNTWFNCDDGCVYFCQEDGCWLAPKGCPQPGGELLEKTCAPDIDTFEEGSLDRCNYNSNGIPTAMQIDAWLDQNLEFSATAITGFTNPCCNTVQGSTNSSANQCSAAFQSNNSDALGNRTVVEAGNNTDISATSRFSVASGNANIIAWGWQSHVNGQNNILGGAGRSDNNLVSGANNQVAVGANAGTNVVGGSGNLLATTNVANFNGVFGRDNLFDDASGNTVSGIGNDLDDAAYNQVSGGGNILNGIDGVTQFNTVSGFGNTVQGDGSNGNLVVGGGNTLDAAIGGRQTFWNVVGGQGNFVDSTITGNGSTTVAAAANNMVVGVDNIMRGTRNVQGGIDNCSEHADGLLAGVSNEQLNGRAGMIVGWGNTVDMPGGAGAFHNGYLTGRATRAITPHTDVTGFAAGTPVKGAGLSLNRTYEKEHATGNVTISGAFTAGFAFPGFGEYAVAERKIKDGLFVQFSGLDGVKVCAANADFDGISRAELAIGAGGGQEADNLMFVHDDMGNRLIEEQEVISTDTVVDEKATTKAQNKADAAGKKAHDIAEKSLSKEERTEYQSVPVASILMEVESKEMVMAPVRNEDYDEKRAAKVVKVGVEMLGRVWLHLTDEAVDEVKVGDYLEAGRGGAGKVADGPTRVRVLAVEDSRAFVVIK